MLPMSLVGEHEPVSVDGMDSLAGDWLGCLSGMLALTAGL